MLRKQKTLFLLLVIISLSIPGKLIAGSKSKFTIYNNVRVDAFIDHYTVQDRLSIDVGLVRSKTYIVMITFHPAYLLRQADQKKYSWVDLKEIRKKIDELNINI